MSAKPENISVPVNKKAWVCPQVKTDSIYETKALGCGECANLDLEGSDANGFGALCVEAPGTY